MADNDYLLAAIRSLTVKDHWQMQCNIRKDLPYVSDRKHHHGNIIGTGRVNKST